MCKLREIHNRKSSPRTDTVFCACSLNCQRAVSVRKRLEKACSLTNFIITLNFTYFKAIFLPNAPYFSNISSYLIMGITALHFMYNLHKAPLNLLHCLQYCSLHLWFIVSVINILLGGIFPFVIGFLGNCRQNNIRRTLPNVKYNKRSPKQKISAASHGKRLDAERPRRENVLIAEEYQQRWERQLHTFKYHPACGSVWGVYRLPARTFRRAEV